MPGGSPARLTFGTAERRLFRSRRNRAGSTSFVADAPYRRADHRADGSPRRSRRSRSARSGNTSRNGTGSAASRSATATTSICASKSGQPLGRYFPDLVAPCSASRAEPFVLDGEIVIPVGDGRDVVRGAADAAAPGGEPRARSSPPSTPARFMLFDMLIDRATDRDLTGAARSTERRDALERRDAAAAPPGTRALAGLARPRAGAGWLHALGTGRDGVVAKRADCPYRAGKRDGMVKIKLVRTADCVVGGFRYLAQAARGRLAAARPLRRRRASSIMSASPAASRARIGRR